MEIEVLLQRLEALEDRVGGLESQNIFLKHENILLKKENKHLKKENSSLQARLSKFENPKNSRNSSIPPSKDENRPKKNQSLRKPTDRKPGGQKGREGKTLEMTANPDVVIKLQPDYCATCGASLQEMHPIKKNSRQIVDIPPIKAVYTEYQTFSKVCNCGCQTTAEFPQRVKTPVSYGGNIESLIAYSMLVNTCLLPG